MSSDTIRQVFLDTETTGINKFGVPYEGHRIIEIGAVEVINRRITGRHYHTYINPNRIVDLEAYNIHGISNAFLEKKPIFNKIANEFLEFIKGAELIIHNAEFDIGFIDQEFYLLNQSVPNIKTFCKVTDSLAVARHLFPGKRNNLDALCKRYAIQNSKRTLHGALLDAHILAKVYLAMTGGQTLMDLQITPHCVKSNVIQDIECNQKYIISLKVIYANNKELKSHQRCLDLIENKNNICLWRGVCR